jgi:HEAT repeat protein
MTCAVPKLFVAVDAPEPEVRLAALKALGLLASAAELPQLLDRLAAATSSADIGAAEEAVSQVCLQAPHPDLCLEQVEAALAPTRTLAEARAGREQSSLQQVEARLAQPRLKCSLVRVLSTVGGTNALKGLLRVVDDPAPDVHAAAIRALAGWHTVDAAPELLALARGARDATDRTLCLRGLLGLAGQTDLPDGQRLAFCRQTAGLVAQADEKKLLLAALGSINSPEALSLIRPYLDDAAAREEAANATVAVAEKLLQRKDAAKLARGLLGPLEQAAQASVGTALAERAKPLIEQARAKADGK